jgi:hypothetical protein
MRQLHERLPVHENAPSPKRLRDLAGQCVLLGKQYDRFRQVPNTPERSHFVTVPPAIVVPDVHEAPEGFSYEQRHAARVARVGERMWSLRLLSTYVVMDHGIGLGSERRTCSFEWNDEQATLAERRIDVVPQADPLALVDEIDRGVQVPDDVASVWGFEASLREVTADDVSLLIDELAHYQSGIQYGNGYLSAA